jgi:hypothetical protein
MIKNLPPFAVESIHHKHPVPFTELEIKKSKGVKAYRLKLCRLLVDKYHYDPL